MVLPVFCLHKVLPAVINSTNLVTANDADALGGIEYGLFCAYIYKCRETMSMQSPAPALSIPVTNVGSNLHYASGNYGARPDRLNRFVCPAEQVGIHDGIIGRRLQSD